MPDISRYSIDTLLTFLLQLVDTELSSVLIFGVIPDEFKDE